MNVDSDRVKDSKISYVNKRNLIKQVYLVFKRTKRIKLFKTQRIVLKRICH